MVGGDGADEGEVGFGDDLLGEVGGGGIDRAEQGEWLLLVDHAGELRDAGAPGIDAPARDEAEGEKARWEMGDGRWGRWPEMWSECAVGVGFVDGVVGGPPEIAVEWVVEVRWAEPADAESRSGW